jgi:hypothetical protein
MLLVSSRFGGVPDLAENVAKGAVARLSTGLTARDETPTSLSGDDRRRVIFFSLGPTGRLVEIDRPEASGTEFFLYRREQQLFLKWLRP